MSYAIVHVPVEDCARDSWTMTCFRGPTEAVRSQMESLWGNRLYFKGHARVQTGLGGAMCDRSDGKV